MTKKEAVRDYFIKNAYDFRALHDGITKNSYVVCLVNPKGRIARVYSNGDINTYGSVHGRRYHKQFETAKGIHEFLKRNGYIK